MSHIIIPPAYLPFEKDFVCDVTAKWCLEHWNVPIAAVVVYLLCIYFGPKILKGKEAFDLNYPLALWNIFLSIFSFLGAARTVPFLLMWLSSHGFESSVCTHPDESWAAAGAIPIWAALMNFSKFFELFDTAFIVLRKKPLIFLHWYHHVTVLLFCWSAYSIPTASGIYFIALNYTVHAVMYGYYALKALGLCPKSFPASMITNMQTGQMFIGIFICLSAWYYKLNGVTCHNDINNMYAGALMYLSYLYLFVDFAINKYTKKRAKKAD